MFENVFVEELNNLFHIIIYFVFYFNYLLKTIFLFKGLHLQEHHEFHGDIVTALKVDHYFFININWLTSLNLKIWLHNKITLHRRTVTLLQLPPTVDLNFIMSA